MTRREETKCRCLVEHGWWVGLGHPRITISEVVGGCGRWVYGWKEDGIHAINDVEHEGRVYRVSDRESHGDETMRTWVNSG